MPGPRVQGLPGWMGQRCHVRHTPLESDNLTTSWVVMCSTKESLWWVSLGRSWSMMFVTNKCLKSLNRSLVGVMLLSSCVGHVHHFLKTLEEWSCFVRPSIQNNPFPSTDRSLRSEQPPSWWEWWAEAPQARPSSLPGHNGSKRERGNAAFPLKPQRLMAVSSKPPKKKIHSNSNIKYPKFCPEPNLQSKPFPNQGLL